MIYALDQSCRAIYVSAEWENLSGRPVADSLGLGWVEQIHPEDRDMIYLAVCQASAQRTSFSARCRVCFADKRYVWVSTDAAPCFSPSHHAFIGLMGSFSTLDDQSEAAASVTVGQAASTVSEVKAASDPLDLVVDHLMIAKALIEAADCIPVSRAIDLGIFLLGRARRTARH